jgi:hypothetical protein
MPVCWFCGENVPEVTKCPKCESEFCELHAPPNLHDCTGTPVPNPYNIPTEEPPSPPESASEESVPIEEKIEAESSQLEGGADESEGPSIQQELDKGTMPIAKTLAGLKDLHIKNMEDLENELKNVLPTEKYALMVSEILEAEDVTVRRLKENFKDLSIGKLTNEIMTLAIGAREKNKLSWDETCELACSILALAAPRFFPAPFGDEEQMGQVTLATMVVGKILDRKEKAGD